MKNVILGWKNPGVHFYAFFVRIDGNKMRTVVGVALMFTESAYTTTEKGAPFDREL